MSSHSSNTTPCPASLLASWCGTNRTGQTLSGQPGSSSALGELAGFEGSEVVERRRRPLLAQPEPIAFGRQISAWPWAPNRGLSTCSMLPRVWWSGGEKITARDVVGAKLWFTHPPASSQCAEPPNSAAFFRSSGDSALVPRKRRGSLSSLLIMEVVLGFVKVCLCGTFCLSGICKLTPKVLRFRNTAFSR